jgi:hypothetical protein
MMSAGSGGYNNSRDSDSAKWFAQTRDRIREVEADLHDQGVKLFANTRAGHHAQLLWRKVKQHLFRGGAVQITTSSLKLGLHREELRRARNVLVDMELIKRRPDGLYVLGRYDWLDEEVRDRFSELKVVEEVLVALSGIVNQVKDPDAA